VAKQATSGWKCEACGARQRKWSGRCSACGAFGKLVEEQAAPAPAGRRPVDEMTVPAASSVSLREVAAVRLDRLATGIPELDRVLGGGLVPGFYGIVGGEPGAGKSTLMTQMLASLARRQLKTIVFSGEESPEQTRLRFERVCSGELPPVEISTETSAERIFRKIVEEGYDVAVIDSINTVFSEQSAGVAGSPSQMRDCAAVFQRAAKQHGACIFLVGQVTKDGDIAGPRMLEHTVDAFLMFEGDRRDQHRLLRALKNRFGTTDELGVFEMTGAGLEPVADPSGLFLSERDYPITGAAVTAVVEGSRPVLCEIQALVSHSHLPQPVRAARGVDPKRLQMLLAVLARKGGLRKLAQSDVYVNVAGGLKIDEPGIDLAVCAAVASALSGRPVAARSCIVGEVSLLGEVRRAPQHERRAKEAERQGLRVPLVVGPLREAVERCLEQEALEEPVNGVEVEERR
jgi:DNA repair protein RadA/Sms